MNEQHTSKPDGKALQRIRKAYERPLLRLTRVASTVKGGSGPQKDFDNQTERGSSAP
jgi:hypothetical protein